MRGNQISTFPLSSNNNIIVSVGQEKNSIRSCYLYNIVIVVLPVAYETLAFEADSRRSEHSAYTNIIYNIHHNKLYRATRIVCIIRRTRLARGPTKQQYKPWGKPDGRRGKSTADGCRRWTRRPCAETTGTAGTTCAR